MRGRVYRRPDPTLATGVFREFKRRISCRHEWEPNVRPVLDENMIVAALIAPGERCVVCDATCLRDPSGKIVEYSTKAERELEEAERNTVENAA